jgi:hypothetical protein
MSMTRVVSETEARDLAECVAVLKSVGAAGTQGGVQTWETVISDAIAHLISAHFEMEKLTDHPLAPTGSAMPMELASQSVWAALVSLDECSLAFWNDRAGVEPALKPFCATLALRLAGAFER